MMDAFGTVRTGISSSRARRTRSVWVVALEKYQHNTRQTLAVNLPKWVTNNEKRYILVLGISKNFIAIRFDHLSVGNRD